MLLKQALNSAKKQTLYEKIETDFYVTKTGLEVCKKTNTV